ncbi:hypothetical protein [Flavihumibacter petaseus]|uniref:Uncharacterized protein n=1 Tax=Flavihumibacter petaseus NBRC 106054 TaxID=1220578 RepID=A0A0E9N489_9BACT|nr:hypothetical protein [Flavihumibacter petaseus]GAO44471.1 hypothetical protein FPE01S_03_05080 [Flavihumibacter petaseus NBRC 106054]
MVYDYVVTLQNRSRKLIDRFSILASGISGVVFFTIFLLDPEHRLIHLVGGAVVLVLAAVNLYKSTRLREAVSYNYILVIAGIIWASMPFSQWLSFLLLIMGLLEKQAKKNLEIGFHQDMIVFNSFPRKKYHWKDFSNIVLRDNLLTLDFVNNRLLQRETIDEEGDADEDEFNAYCRSHLS